jgi:Fe-S-cluster containining protein
MITGWIKAIQKTMVNNRFSETDRIFYSDGYRLAQSFGEDISPETIIEIQTAVYEVVDGLIDSLLKQAVRSEVRVDCVKGCAWCCHQPVYANTLEMLYLQDFLRKKFPADKRKEIRRKAEEKNSKVSALSEDQIPGYKSPCPLLADGSCQAYPARPMACRIYLSSSVESCRHFFTHPDDQHSYPALLDFPLRAGRMLNEGVTAAFRQKGFPVAEIRIEEGLVNLAINHNHGK